MNSRRRFPFRPQETDVSCGPAVVQMIIASQGTELPQQELFVALGTNEQGTRAEALEHFLRAEGFSVERRNDAQWHDLERALGDGAIVIVGYREPSEEQAHYGLVEAIDANMIAITEPLFKDLQRFEREEFERRWTDDDDGAYGERMMIELR